MGIERCGMCGCEWVRAGCTDQDRGFRATYGTTKYCSAYLRNETCPNKNCMFLHEPGEEAESFSRMELSTANSRQNNQAKELQLQQQQLQQQYHQYGHQPQPSRPPPREHHPPPVNHDTNPMARTSSHVGSSMSAGDEGPSALPLTANWAKNPPTPASRPASLVHSLSNPHLPPKLSTTPSPKDVPSSPLVQNVQTVRNQEAAKKGPDRVKSTTPAPTTISASTPSVPATPVSATNVNGKPVGVIGQPAQPPAPVPVAAPTPPPAPPVVAVAAPSPPPLLKMPVKPLIPDHVAEQMQRLKKIERSMSNPKFVFSLSPTAFTEDEYDSLRKIPLFFDKHGGRRRRDLIEKMKKKQRQQISEAGDDVGLQPGLGTQNAVMGMPMRGSTPLQQHRENQVIKDAGQQAAAMQHNLSAIQDSLQAQQSALRAHTPQNVLQQVNGHNFQAMAPQHGQNQTGHARQTSRYTFSNDNLTGPNAVNARSNTAHMAEQLRMMPPQQQIPHQLAQMYGAAPGLGGSLLGSVQQPPPGLKNAPTPPAPGLGGIPMGNMPGLGQFSGMGHHTKSESEAVLLRELLAGNGVSRLTGPPGTSLLRGGDGKRNVPFSAGGKQGVANGRGVVDLGDPSILQARVSQPQHQMQQQHQQQGIQAGGHSQGGYNPNLNAYYASAQAAGRW